MLNRSSVRLALATAALAALAGLSSVASAHHSTAMFEWGKEVKLTNMTIQKWEWTNPHTFIYAKDPEGNLWAFEGMSPNHLSRAGWDKRTLKPGDKVDLTYYKLRDGRRGGFDVRIIKPDGKEMLQLPSAM